MEIKKTGIGVIVGIMVAIFIIMSTTASASAKTVKMTVYDDIIKKGNTVYCGTGSGLYKVKVKNGIVKGKKRLYDGGGNKISTMKKVGNWMYFVNQTTGSMEYFCRVNIKTKTSKQFMVSDGVDGNYPVCYVIKGKKLYYVGKKGINREMSLNGKSKQKTNVKISMSRKKSNAKDYRIIEKVKTDKKGNDYKVSYLKTPKGKYKLGKLRGGWSW